MREKFTHSNVPTMLVLVIGIISIGYGVSRGETPIMFEKAINICLECIGIG